MGKSIVIIIYTEKYVEQCLCSFQYFVCGEFCCRSHLPVEILYLLLVYLFFITFVHVILL